VGAIEKVTLAPNCAGSRIVGLKADLVAWIDFSHRAMVTAEAVDDSVTCDDVH
jgi:hypothetical protein